MPNDSKPVVLIADDEPSTVAMLSSHLRSKGYSVLEASDGDQAWELAHEHLPHLVLLDVMMPGMSGWEVCRKIREAVSLAHTGVIMLTGIGENLNEMTSPLYGADAHLDKPFDFGDLDRAIEETLSRRSAGALGRPDAEAEEEQEDDAGLVRKALRAVTRASAKTKSAPVISLHEDAEKPSLAKTGARAESAPRAAKPAKKAPAKTAPAKKAPPKKAPAKKAPPKKAPAKKAVAKKAPLKKAPAKKAVAKKAPLKKAPAKKAPPKKAPAKKAVAKKAPPKKAPAKKKAAAKNSAPAKKPSKKKR